MIRLLSHIIVVSMSVIFQLNANAETLSLKEIREDRLIIQQWDTSCAAAAMASVFTFTFNDTVTEREVINGLLRQTEPLKVRHRGGFSMLDMKRYAEIRGYKALGFKNMNFEDIRYMDAPIVPVKFHGYNHYVIYKGVTTEGEIHIGDPAFGNRTLSRDEFEAAWIDGIAFVMLRGK